MRAPFSVKWNCVALCNVALCKYNWDNNVITMKTIEPYSWNQWRVATLSGGRHVESMGCCDRRFGAPCERRCLLFSKRFTFSFFVSWLNWTFLTTWLWWRRWWRWCWWITMTIYSTELSQALSRLLRPSLSCFWFIFYYVSAMFIKKRYCYY